MRVDRHGPVDHREGHRQAVNHQPGTGQNRELSNESRIPRPILFRRPSRQCPGDRRPDREIEQLPDQKEGLVQVRLLLLKNRVARNRVGMRPVIQVVHPEPDRYIEERHDRHRSHRRFERPANHHAPRATGQVLDHQQRHAPEHESHPERVRHQVGLIEPRQVGHHEPDDGQHDADETGAHAEALEPADGVR